MCCAERSPPIAFCHSSGSAWRHQQQAIEEKQTRMMCKSVKVPMKQKLQYVELLDCEYFTVNRIFERSTFTRVM